MATVYERICEYQRHNRFRFTAQGKRNVGMYVRKEWNKLQSNMLLDFVDSEEPEGTFKAIDYPEHFIGKIDECIREYVNHSYQLYLKRISEKPAKQLPKQTAYPEPEKKRERKRTPLKKPVFSGSNYKK